jgi:hypothetical protein
MAESPKLALYSSAVTLATVSSKVIPRFLLKYYLMSDFFLLKLLFAYLSPCVPFLETNDYHL